MKAESREAKSASGALGFRVKSGWARAVLLVGPVQSPQVVDQRVVHLSDPAVPESRQPYHAGMGALEEDSSKIERRVQVVRRVTNRSVSELLQEMRRMGYPLRGAALAVGSLIEPVSIKNPHIRAHALEGQLFRTVLEEALRSCGLPCSVLMERHAYSKVAAVLARPEVEFKRAVADLGRLLDGRWRAEEKIAAVAAWMALAKG